MFLPRLTIAASGRPVGAHGCQPVPVWGPCVDWLGFWVPAACLGCVLGVFGAPEGVGSLAASGPGLGLGPLGPLTTTGVPLAGGEGVGAVGSAGPGVSRLLPAALGVFRLPPPTEFRPFSAAALQPSSFGVPGVLRPSSPALGVLGACHLRPRLYLHLRRACGLPLGLGGGGAGDLGAACEATQWPGDLWPRWYS